MAIAALFNIPGTPEEYAEWAFAHSVHHLDVNNRIYDTRQIALPFYLLDPFDPKDPNSAEAWAYNHELMHQNQNQVLGIDGFDLSTVDWSNRNQVAAWIQLNANEHYQAATILQVG